MQKVQRWRTALTTAANLKGYDIRDEIESEKIQQIVDDIFKFCKSTPFLQHIVGINAHLEELKSRLQIEINDVRVLGIWGIGGVGKTTIAKALFDTLSDQFKAACFLADVKETPRINQLHSLQNTLLSKLLRKKDDYVDNKHEGKSMIRSRLCSMKVLIVLDDIDHQDHLEYLAGDRCWFGNGSRVIVTTRNRHLIENDDAIYEVLTLPDDKAMQLFNQHAFKEKDPDECFKELSLEVIDHAKGLPLALKVWGSSLHNKGLKQWRSTVDQIKKTPNSEIVQQLKISYDGLEKAEQEIFLDIACFFRGYKRTEVMQILESCGFGAEHGLDVLIDKSLVFIYEDEWIEMHDLIEDMGKYIVKMQKDSGKGSRIWNFEDFEDVIQCNTETMAVEAIWFTDYEQICFSKEAMKNMQKLRILCIPFFSFESQSENDGSFEYLSNNLRWVVWHGYPWKLLPQNFNPTKLVHFDLKWSSLHHLWNETKQLRSLQRLDLSDSQSLKRTPDFTGMPNLEYLDLRGCTSLEEVHHSLRYSRKLIELNLDRCVSLERFPYVNVESLKSLYLMWNKFPTFIGRMKPELKIMMTLFTGIQEIPSSIIHLQDHLTELHSTGMKNLVSLPSTIFMLKDLVKLKVLNLSDCNLTDGGLPEDIGCLHSLKWLYLCGNNFEHFPRSLAQLGALQSLNLSKCNKLTQLPEFPQQLRTITAEWSNDSICNSLFRNISSLQHDISVSDSLSLRVFDSRAENIPSWFNHQGMDTSVSVNLPENWYVSDNFLGFAVCYKGELIDDITAHLIPLCDDGMSSMTKEFVFSNRSFYVPTSAINFLLVPLAGLWDASKANGKTPNDYGHFRLSFSGEVNKFGEVREFGVRLLYIDEAELHIGIRRSRYEEGSCSSLRNKGHRYEGVWSCCFPLLQLFPTRPGF